MSLSKEQILLVGVVALGSVLLLGSIMMSGDESDDDQQGHALLSSFKGDPGSIAAADERGQIVETKFSTADEMPQIKPYDLWQHLWEKPYEPTFPMPKGSTMLPSHPHGATDYDDGAKLNFMV